jgi:hypothetical protein
MKGILFKPEVWKAKQRVLDEYGEAQTRRVIKPNKELQAAHLITRHDHTTRWDISNVVGICGGCHRAIDSHAEAKIEFAIRILGEAEYDRLYVLDNMTTKQSPVDLKLKEIELRTLLKEV